MDIVTIRRIYTGADEVAGVGGSKLQKSPLLKELIKLIREHQPVTSTQLATMLEEPQATICARTIRLHKLGLVRQKKSLNPSGTGGLSYLLTVVEEAVEAQGGA